MGRLEHHPRSQGHTDVNTNTNNNMCADVHANIFIDTHHIDDHADALADAHSSHQMPLLCPTIDIKRKNARSLDIYISQTMRNLAGN
jgi:hypothetical protein